MGAEALGGDAIEATLRRASAFLREVRKRASPQTRDTATDRSDAHHALAKTIWGSPAGKKRLAPRLVKLIPAHKTYVEPFAGSAAVFFEKPPVAREVLSDADPEIAAAYKALAKLTDRELAALKKQDWVGRRQTFEALKKAAPRGKIAKLHRFLYLSHFAYGALRGKSFDGSAEGIESRAIKRIEKHRERLQNVIVRSGHYLDVVKEFDGPNTFFFLDPPYPGYNVQVGENRFDEAEFRKVLDGIRGKFLVTYGVRGKLNTEGFHVRKIRTPRTIASMRGVTGPKTLGQLLISNYALTQKRLGDLALDDVVDTLELEPSAAADLEHARALAKALAEETQEPAITALYAALDSLEGSDLERAGTLAHTLEPITRRLEFVMRGDSTVTASIRKARPRLKALSGAVATPRVAKRGTSPAGDEDALAQLLQKRVPLLKTEEERFVLGIVLEPETVDAQQDIYSADEVRDAAHRFMEQHQNIGLMHRGYVNDEVKILESYVAPVAFELDGTSVRKGTWLLALRVLSDALWAKIKSGALTGLSIGGSAHREADAAEPPQAA